MMAMLFFTSCSLSPNPVSFEFIETESRTDRQTESDTQKVRQSENQNNRATKESALVHLPKHWVQN